MYYTLFGLIAVIIVTIINHDVILNKGHHDLASKNYRIYLGFILVYFLIDALWGIFDATDNYPLLYADTLVYHIAVAISIILWCRYVVSYLNASKKLAYTIFGLGNFYCLFTIISLAVNFHSHVFFWFDENGIYLTGFLRDIALCYQMMMYSVIAILSFRVFYKTSDRTRIRYFAICAFSLIMTTGIVIQMWHPYLPLYSIGLMMGMCTLHVFIHEDEKNEITQKLEMNEKVLKENNSIIANAGYGIWKIQMLSEGKHRMEANDKLQEILGIKSFHFTPEELYTYYHNRLKDDVDDIEQDDYASMREGAIRTRLLKWNHPEKGDIYLHAGGRNYITADNEEVISGFCADVTESKKKEKRSDLVIKSLARSYQFLTYIKMSSFTYITYNWNLDITDDERDKYTTGDIRKAIDFACEQRVSPIFQDEMRKFSDITTINDRMKSTNALINQFKDMNGVWHEWSYIIADRNPDGSIKNLIWAIRKIEDEKRAELRRQRILEDNIAANKAKTMFLQNMSHEIRTPLNALFGFAQLLGMPDGSWTDDEKAQYNTYIHNSYNLLDMLIGDIIDIADSDHGNYRINISEVKVNQVCTNAIMPVEFRTPGNVKMYFTSDLPDDHVINSDGRRIQQVLINYLTNACKHTQRGEIHLHCSTTEHPGRLTFSVTDTGEGVPADKADVIFNRFTKLNQFSQGSGLGLNICQMVAQKLDGEVYLDKSYTDGARFVFVINDK